MLSLPRGGGGDTGSEATTDRDGRFLLKVTTGSDQDRELNLIITKDGYASFDSPTTKVPKQPAGVIDLGQFTLQPGRSARVRVVDATGKPLAGAVVEPMGDYAQRRQIIRVDEQGHGVLRNLPDGVIKVSARYGTLNRQTEIVVDEESAGGEPVTIEMQPQPTPSAVTSAPQFPEPPPLGSAAPELSLVGWTDGGKHALADYRGKVVVLDFWGIWCSACMNGLPAQKELEAKYAGRHDVVFLGIHSAGCELSQVKKLLRLKNWQLLTGLDRGDDAASGATAMAYGAHGWPTRVIIDRDGRIAYNSNLEKWNAVSVLKEQARIAKALHLPPDDLKAPREAQIARTNAMQVFRMSELIDRVLERP